MQKKKRKKETENKSCEMVTHFSFAGENEVSDNGEEGVGPDLVLDTPPVPPRRRDRKRHTPPRPISNGLPPTPKVHMGACFSKVGIQLQ